MAAPDYVSQVRGIISDLREDYLKKQQLYQQEQQANQSLALNYAQLAANRENAQRQANIENMRLEASKAQAASELAKYEETSRRQERSLQLDEERLKLSQERQKAEFDLQEKSQQQNNTASQLEKDFITAYSNGDVKAQNEALDRMAQSGLDTQQRATILRNAQTVAQNLREQQQNEINLTSLPKVQEIVTKVTTLNPSEYTPSQYQAKLFEFQQLMADTKNNDPIHLKTFDAAMKFAAKKGDDFFENETQKAINGTIASGEKKQLPPEFQKEYEALKADPTTSSLAWEGFTAKVNIPNSIQQLKEQDERNLSVLNFLKMMYPSLANMDLSQFLPNLSPSMGENGLIDPRTGLLTKRFYTTQSDFDKKYTTGSMVTGTSVPGMDRFMASLGIGQYAPAPSPAAAPATAPSASTTPPVPTKSRSNFDVAYQNGKLVPLTPFGLPPGASGTAAVIPSAPQSKVQISPQTIDEIVRSYNQDPNGLYKGRSLREVVAYLQSQNIALPGLRVQAVAQGQEQKR